MLYGGLYADHENHDIDWINTNINKPEDTGAALTFEEGANSADQSNKSESLIKYKIVQDMLWSDPRKTIGMRDNVNRGQGQAAKTF